MGIPSYFAYLMRNHKKIIARFTPQHVDNLYLDSNSIVYDVVRSLKYDPANTAFDSELIRAVCAKLQSYLDLVKPRRVFIAFDGVPPMAKMKQQRDRRYKSLLFPESSTLQWNTVQITPGTTFMHALDAALRAAFHPSRYELFQLSTSEEPGEGEHKIFEWIRKVSHVGQRTLIYGLDSDLIILALNHSHLGDFALLREAPQFKVKSEGLQLLNINLLASEIRGRLGPTKLKDYIFLTLFMGNDFMPHFPSLNLRTRGFETLLQTYSESVKEEHLFTDTIQWPVVYKLVKALAAKEKREFQREYTSRNQKVVEHIAVNTPLLRREMEHYINPMEPQWEARYYTTLFQSDPQVAPQVCTAYYRMLEWNMLYYTSGCPNWRLYYPYMYPPLLVDLVKAVHEPPLIETATEALLKSEFLAFIFPSECAHFAQEPYVAEKLFPIPYWAFCTFMWESHLLF